MGALGKFTVVAAVLLCKAALAQPLTIPGAGPPEVPLRALAAAFEAAHPGLTVHIPPSTGIAGGIRAVKNGEAPLSRIARRLTADEEREGLRQFVYGADAVIFAAGSRVDVQGLSSQQAIDLFAGRIESWKALGGADVPVRLAVRESTEIAHREIRRHIPPFAAIRFPEHAKLVNADYEMVEILDRFRTAVGWMTRSSVLSSKGGVRALSLDGVPPSPENVASSKYPMAVEHVLIYRDGQLGEPARRFVAFVQSDAGRRVLAEHGVVRRDN